MEQNRRVYPAERGGRAARYALLLLAVVLLIPGLLGRGQELSVQPVVQETPMPEAFDETMAQKDITLPEARWYALQVGAFENEEAARALAARFAKRGAAGYVWTDGRCRVLAAAYPSREDAQLVRQQLSQQHQVESYLYEIDFPAIQLHMKGMQGQLDIWEAAFLHGHDLAAQLQNISVAMDRQEMSVQEAADALAALAQQVEGVSLRLKQRFRLPGHEAVSGLIDLFDSYGDFAPTVAEQSASAAGTLVKKEQLEVLWRLKRIYALFEE